VTVSPARRLVAGLAVAVLWMSVGLASRAEAAVYWGNSSTISAANLDGGAPQLSYFRPVLPAQPLDFSGGIAVSDTHLYWQGFFGKIGRVSLDGLATIESIATPLPLSSGLVGPGGIAVSASHVYWGNFQGGTLGRAGLDGSGADNAFVTGLEYPCGVAVDGTYVYWTDRGGVGRAKLDGTEVDRGFISAPDGACGVAVDGRHLYWGGKYSRAIGRADIDGDDPNDAFITGIGAVWGIAADSTHIFWTDHRDGMAYASIARADLDGTGVNRDLIAVNDFNIDGVAVDSRLTPPPMSLPSRSIRFGKLRHDRRKGVAVLEVWVPEAGELVLKAPRLGWKLLKGAPPPPYRGGSFRWRLKLWPGARGRVAHRIRAQLRRRGRAPVSLRIAYSETGKAPTTVTKRISLLRRPHRPR